MILADLPLFALPPAVRRDDPATSREAAARIRPQVRALHRAVWDAIETTGPVGLTDRELEILPQFAQYGPSTVRKRRSELYQLGHLAAAGTRDRLTVWVTVGVTL
jgi:hypothetical protein